jgi:hypothetical protein
MGQQLSLIGIQSAAARPVQVWAQTEPKRKFRTSSNKNEM